MSTKPAKPAQQEIAHNLALMMNRDKTARMFCGYEETFTRRFWVQEPAPGAYRLVEELPGSVLLLTSEKAIRNALLEWTAEELPRVEELGHYKITASRADAVVQYWMGLAKSKLTDKVYPVRELSEPGYCFHRFEFDAKPGPTPLYDKFLQHIKTNLEAFLAFHGGLLDPEWRRQFYLWLHGVGGDGKGTHMRILYRLFKSAYAVCASSSKALESQFFTSGLLGKRIAAFQDCHNTKLPLCEVFMQLAGGDPLRIEPKGKDAYTTESDATPIISSNYEPNLTNSPAHIRRACMVEMTPRIEQPDDDPQTYEERLWQEIPHIVWKWKEAWREMKEKHGGFVFDTEAAKIVADDGEAHCHHLFDKYFVCGDNLTLTQAALHGLLTERERIAPHEMHAFKNYLKRLAGVTYKQLTGGTRPRVWFGIGIAAGQQMAKQETRF